MSKIAQGVLKSEIELEPAAGGVVMGLGQMQDVEILRGRERFENGAGGSRSRTEQEQAMDLGDHEVRGQKRNTLRACAPHPCFRVGVTAVACAEEGDPGRAVNEHRVAAPAAGARRIAETTRR